MDGQGSRTAESWKEWEGQIIDGFHLLQYLGGSDHSGVFLTKLPGEEPGRAAIKLITAGPDSAEIHLSRWKLAAELSHPRLIRIFKTGCGQLGNAAVLYVVMEYAQEDLSQILPDRPLTPAESQQMLVPLLDVLVFMHGKGFVHGHIKPANIMAVDDYIKISSDGLSRVEESIIGSRQPSAYDPPESAGTGMSPAADVWSLGVTLVECLTQRLPVWDQTQQAEPVLPDTVPQPFFDIARNCLRRDPRRRWTLADIAARLQPAVPALRESPALKPPRTSVKRRYLVLATVVLAVLAALALPRLLNHHPQPQRAPSSALEQPEAKPPAGGLVGGAVVNRVLPDVPERARDTIRGTVRVTVRVAVDPSGNVTRAVLDSPGPSRYFAGLALQAARGWKFRAPKIDAQNVPSEWILRFQFERTATNVVPVQAVP